MEVRKYQESDLNAMRNIWNTVVLEANAFPQTLPLTQEEAGPFFASQTYTGVADADGEIMGLYILHPNNIGRCGHIANASYAVRKDRRGLHIGEALVRDCIEQARNLEFRILQFNAVVASNSTALHLYKKLGFHSLGTVPGGFLLKDGTYEDIHLFYYPLV